MGTGRRALMLAVGVALSGCIIDAPTGQGQASSPSRPRPAVSSGPVTARVGAVLARAAPDSDASGDDKVELTTAQFQPAQLIPGEQQKITLTFKVLDTIPEDYIVFVHVEDVDGKVERINVDHRPMGGNYPTTQWKKGEVVKDEFGFGVPPGLNIRGVNIYVGLWDPRADRRMKLRNPGQVRNDGADRLLIGVLPVAR